MAVMTTVLEFGTSNIICISEVAQGGLLPATSHVQYEGMTEGRFINSSELSRKITDLIANVEKHTGKMVRGAYVGVPGSASKVTLLYDTVDVIGGRVGKGDMNAVIANLAEQKEQGYTLIASKPAYFLDEYDEVYIDPPVGISAQEVMVCQSNIYVKSSFYDAVTRVLGSHRIRLLGMLSEMESVAMHYIPQDVRDEGAIILDFGYREINVGVVFGDAILANETIPRGSREISKSIAGSFRITEELADSLKKAHVFGLAHDDNDISFVRSPEGKMLPYHAKNAQELIERKLCAMIREVDMKLREMRNIVSPDMPVFLCGAGIAMTGVTNFLSNIMRRNVTEIVSGGTKTLPTIYNTSVALLDNAVNTVYDLEVNSANSNSNAKGSFFGFSKK